VNTYLFDTFSRSNSGFTLGRRVECFSFFYKNFLADLRMFS
jgi:hypothetical protein